VRSNPLHSPAGAITSEVELNGVKKLLIADWLRKELNRSHPSWLAPTSEYRRARDEDDREFSARRYELALEFKAALPRQSDTDFDVR
jgi:hypothetical protein